MVTALAPFPFWEPHAPGGGLALLGAYPRGPGVFVHLHITGIRVCRGMVTAEHTPTMSVHPYTNTVYTSAYACSGHHVCPHTQAGTQTHKVTTNTPLHTHT